MPPCRAQPFSSASRCYVCPPDRPNNQNSPAAVRCHNASVIHDCLPCQSCAPCIARYGALFAEVTSSAKQNTYAKATEMINIAITETATLDRRPHAERSLSMAEAYSLYDNGEIDSKTLRSLSISYAQTLSVCSADVASLGGIALTPAIGGDVSRVLAADYCVFT